jgi:hypothetical protein
VSDDARDLLRTLLHEILAENGNGQVPSVPAPPTAAVLRPSTWDRPPAPGEIIGDGAAPAAPAARGAEHVSIATDADLDRFVRALATRCEDPAQRADLRSGAVRFTLGGGAASLRIESGAVTEKTVREAAASGQRLVLAPRAVMTPLAREKARALKVEVERERRC